MTRESSKQVLDAVSFCETIRDKSYTGRISEILFPMFKD